MTFTERTGFMAQEEATASPSTLAVTPVAIGDLMMLLIGSAIGAGGTITVSGGGVTTWNALPSSETTGGDYYLYAYWGVVTATGSQTITVTYPNEADDYTVLIADSWASPGATGYAVTQSGETAANSATVLLPSLTSGPNGGLYWSVNGNVAGTTPSIPGFTVVDGDGGLGLVYDASLAANTNYAPSFSQTSGEYLSIGAIFAAVTGTTASTSFFRFF